jgi:hypothetical protein
MTAESYGAPIIIGVDDRRYGMTRVALSEKEAGTEYDEEFIQKLAFEHPNCLPIDQIDRAFTDYVTVCTELNTPSGPLDALYVTTTGRLIVLEAKLWNNPEARRKLVAQVLDYAKELARWDYEDLQREVSRRLGRKGNVLYEIARAHQPGLDESRFVDEVHTNLKRGRFLLMIVGDGIREGAGAIADFLNSVGSLEFTFGLVELALFRNPNIGLLVQPRVIARTVEVGRVVVQLPDGATLSDEGHTAAESEELTETQKFYTEFWSEFLAELQLDDPSQKMANVTKSENIYFPMPPSGAVIWVSAYFSKSAQCVGVFLRFSKAFGDTAYEVLVESEDEINKDLGIPVSWRDRGEGHKTISSHMDVQDVHSAEYRHQIKTYFSETVNLFINTFRHRLERIVQNQA